jgi:ABC-type transporter Mla subunit MlaD
MGRFSRRREEAERLAAELVALRQQLDDLGTRLNGVASASEQDSQRVNELVSKSSEVDALIRQVRTEVTHQLSELSTDLERLAQEQARYQITFRQDLAEVADIAKKKTT